MIKGILLNTGLNRSLHYPCIIYGVLNSPSSPACTSDLQYQLHVGIYVNDFVFYLYNPYQEQLLKTLLQYHIQVEFMWNLYYFLGNEFNWIQHTDVNISVYLWQLIFTGFNDHIFSVYIANKVPNITPYIPDFPIDSIPPVDPLYPDLTCLRQVYQSIVGCIYWLTTCNVYWTWYCACTNIYGLIHQCLTSSTLQGSCSCYQISYKYKWIWHIFPLKFLFNNTSIQSFPKSLL